MLIPRKKRACNARIKASMAFFIIIQLIFSIFASSTALASSIKYDDSYTYEGGSSSDGIAWGGSSLSTKLDNYASGTQVACFDWCNDGTLDRCFGESGNMGKCKKSTVVKAVCDAGKCETWGWWEFWRSIGEWHGIDTKSAGDRWKCSVWSRYYWNCDSTNYNYENTPYAYSHYVVYPRQFDCDDQKISTYDDEIYADSWYDFRADQSCSGSRLCDEDKDDSLASFGLYGTTKPNEPCSVQDGNPDCDSNSDCFPSSICDCDDWWDCNYDLLSGDKDYCCPSGQKWDGSKCATPCKDNDGDGHKDGSCGGDDCNDSDTGVWKKNSCDACAKEPSGLGDSCTAGVGACQKTGKNKCNSAGTGVTCDASPGNPSTETCDGTDNDCDGETDEGVKNACGGCGNVPSETCGDGKDNDCDGLTDEGCCSEPTPYNCAKTGTCWTREKCDEAITCNGQWWACVDSAMYEPTCVNNKIGCCEPQYQYYCPDNNFCFSQDGFCDGRKVENCNGKYSVCNKKTDVGQCFGDVLRCCPAGESWWESDKQCHKSSEPQKCSVPDGSSANCDCDSDSNCPSSKPYCEENYPSPISDGHDGCISTVPEYCGNGKCGSGEDYKNCPNDCVSPSGTLDVYVNRGTIPLQGAKVSVDNSFKSFTDKGGKALISTSQGKKLVRVDCPDGSFCEEKYVSLKGYTYANFYCFCNLESDTDNDGYLDSDELIIGTNPKDSASHLPDNLYFEGLAGCVISPVAFALKWKSLSGDKNAIIQSTETVVQALNVTSVTSSSIGSNTHALAAALMQADLPVQVIKSPKGLTLNNSVLTAEYMTGIMAGDGLILITTDNQTGTTALIEVGADCLGILVGVGYGFGQGTVDEIKGGAEAVKVLVPALGKAVWLYFIHNNEFNEKLYGGVRELVKAAYEIHRERNALGWKLVMSIFEKGQRVNVFKEDWIYPNKGAYEKFQYGFYSGYLTGYASELIISAIFGPKILAAFAKGTLIAVKAGVKALETLRLAVVEKLGALGFTEDIIKTVNKLPYFNTIIQKLSDAEVNILGKLTKIDSGWAKGMKEEEALTAIRNYDKAVNSDKLITEAKMEKLLSTNLGRETIKLSESTPELLAKQSKLVEKWGVDEVNKITKKAWLKAFDEDRIEGLRRVLDVAPEDKVGKLTTERAAMLIGNSKLTAALKEFKGIEGFEKVGQRLIDSEPKSPMFEAKKALELKEKGKTVTRFEHKLFKQNGDDLTDIDITYTDGGVTKYVETSARNWKGLSSKELSDEIINMKKKLGDYISHAGNDPSRVKFASEQPIVKELGDTLAELKVEII